MALKARNIPKVGGKGSGMPKQPTMEPGTYPSRVVQVIDMGLQPQRPYKGEPKNPAYELMVTYECLDEFCVDENGVEMEDKPRWISETFPLHNIEADLAKSTKRYKALDPDMVYDGDWGEVVGTPCMVTTVNNVNGDNVYTNVASVTSMRARDAAKAPELINEPKVFSLDEPDVDVFRSFPQWIQDKIKGNLEYDGSALQKALEGAPKQEEKKGKANPRVEEENAQEDFVDDVQGDDDIPW